MSTQFTDNIDFAAWSRWAQQVRFVDECRTQIGDTGEIPTSLGSGSLKAHICLLLLQAELLRGADAELLRISVGSQICRGLSQFPGLLGENQACMGQVL